jgi:hypothetical protein
MSQTRAIAMSCAVGLRQGQHRVGWKTLLKRRYGISNKTIRISGGAETIVLCPEVQRAVRFGSKFKEGNG